MSSSFFLPNTSSGSKIKASGMKRKYEGQSRGKPKTPKKFSAGGKKKAQDKNKFSKGHRNEEILSDASDVEGREKDKNLDYIGSDGEQMGDSEEETAEEKRLRLAKKYLEEIERQEKERIGELTEAQNDNHGIETAVNLRLRRDDLEESGKLTRLVAHNYETHEELADIPRIQILRDHKVHKASVTCLMVSSDGMHMLSGSKDGGLVLWGMNMKDMEQRFQDSGMTLPDTNMEGAHENKETYPDTLCITKLARVDGGRKGCEDKHIGHCTSVNCVAISSDSQFIASGDDSNLIFIWKIIPKDKVAINQGEMSHSLDRVHVFRGHKSPVSGVAFRLGTHTLYSCSHDRAVKVWNLDEMAYVETLFGHQDRITGIDAGTRERVLTSGGRDGTARIWKIVEESQLVFNAPAASGGNSKDASSKGSGIVGSGSVDAIKLLDEQHFVTCGEDGHVSLWNVMKKKPVSTITRAHGSDSSNNDPRWISAITTLHNTDLIASGSCDGHLKLWKCGEKFRSLVEIASFPISSYLAKLTPNSKTDLAASWSSGFVNSICFHPNGRALLVGIGQEHRLGRWWRTKEARNGILVIPLLPKKEPERHKLE